MDEPLEETGSFHLITDHDFVQHSISKNCPCKPELIATNIWKHNPIMKYRTYKVSEDGKIDMITSNGHPKG